jgi:hypothetical protein
VRSEIERALVESFIAPVKRERWLELLRTEKGRRKLRASLPHFAAFDPATVGSLGAEAAARILDLSDTHEFRRTYHVLSHFGEQ